MAKSIIDKALEELFYPTILSNGFINVGGGSFLTKKGGSHFLVETDVTSGNHLRFGLFQILEPVEHALRTCDLKCYGDWLSPYGVGRKVHLYSCDDWNTVKKEHTDFIQMMERIVAPWIISASPISEPERCSYQTSKVKVPAKVPDFTFEETPIQRLPNITELQIKGSLFYSTLEEAGFTKSTSIPFQFTRKRDEIYDVLRGELDRDGLFIILRVYSWVPEVEDATIDLETTLPRMTNGGWLGDQEVGAGRSWLVGDVKLNKEAERSLVAALTMAALPYFERIQGRAQLSEEIQVYHERQYLGRDTYAPIQNRVTGSSSVGEAVKLLSPILTSLGGMFMEPDTFVFGTFPETVSLLLRDDQKGFHICVFDFRGGEAKEHFLSDSGTLVDQPVIFGLEQDSGHDIIVKSLVEFSKREKLQK